MSESGHPLLLTKVSAAAATFAALEAAADAARAVRDAAIAEAIEDGCSAAEAGRAAGLKREAARKAAAAAVKRKNVSEGPENFPGADCRD